MTQGIPLLNQGALLIHGYVYTIAHYKYSIMIKPDLISIYVVLYKIKSKGIIAIKINAQQNQGQNLPKMLFVLYNITGILKRGGLK